MDALQTGIITLLRSALNGERLTLPETFDWSKASNLIYAHHLTGLAVHGASMCGIPRSNPAVVQLTASFCKGLQASKSQMKALRDVQAIFDANGIDYMPIKGAVIKALYPRPEYRIMGDADILIRPEQYPRIRQVLAEAGMQEVSESDYELVWHCPGLKLELHTCLMSPLQKKYYAYYRDSWRFARKNESGSGCHLSAEDHFVYLLVHFAKHYLSSTICAKDICDFWVWKKAHPEMDEAYILQELDRLQLGKFYENLHQLLACWFEGEPATEVVELITRAAFSGGVSEEFNDSSAKGTMQRYADEGDSLSQKKRKWLVNAVFPSRATLAYQYPVLKKWPVLLPVFWAVRWFSALFRDRDRLKRGMIIMKLNADGFAQYNDHLTAVGLEAEETD